MVLKNVYNMNIMNHFQMMYLMNGSIQYLEVNIIFYFKISNIKPLTSFSPKILAMEYDPMWRRPTVSDMCRDFYKLDEKYSKSKPFLNIKILSVDDAILEHKSNNQDKQLA